MEKKKNFGLGILKAIGSVLAFIVIAFIFWVALGLADRKPSYNAIPADFSLYARTDSAWDSLEPLLDLQAAEILFSDMSLTSARNMLFQLRTSEFRNKWFVKSALKKRVDLALYGKGDFLVVIDSGFLASPVRAIPFLYGMNKISVKNLSLVDDFYTDAS